MLTKNTIQEVMSKVMKDEQRGIINEDTMFMIETVLTEGNAEELINIVGNEYYEVIEDYISDSTFILIEWFWEGEGLTQTKVRLSYLNDWEKRNNYPQYRVIKTL